MTEKIEFYSELLHIDPSSKVFYPLAVLLFESGRLEESAKVLRQGLAAHGDHLEARLLLLEVVTRLGSKSEASAEAETVQRILSRFPAFWSLWAATASKESKDLALALNFLATFFQGQTISWAELIQSAFDHLSEGKLPPYGEEVVPYLESESGFATASAPAGEQPRDVRAAERFPEREPLGAARREDKRSLSSRDQTPSARGGASERKPGGSLRTRTMADLLAAQGDFEGAAEIYEELLQASGDDRQRQSLIEALGRVRAESAQKKGQPFFGGKSKDARTEAGMHSSDRESGEKSLEKEKLIDMLELLAQRLEGHSQP